MRVVLVMGVAGSGKTTVGAAVAAELGARFVEGDDAHPRANVDKMARGIPLTDADRRPWLKALHGSIVSSVKRGEEVVVACSALKRAHRKQLLGGDPPIAAEITTVFLSATPELLRARLARRKGHFFDPALLDDQLATLEPPKGDQALVLDAARPVGELVEEVVRRVEPAPPPERPAGSPELRAVVRKRLLAEPGVVEEKSKFSGNVAYMADGKEFAHFHSASVIDLRVPRALQKPLRGDPRVTFRPRPADWIEVEFLTDEDVEMVLELARSGLADARSRAEEKAGRNRRR